MTDPALIDQIASLQSMWLRAADGGLEAERSLRATASHEDAAYERGKSDARRFCAESLSSLLTEARAQAQQHRCSGCGLRWEGELTGAELCGDCWRKARAQAQAPTGKVNHETRSPDGDGPWSGNAEKRADVSDGEGTSPVLGQRAGEREQPDRPVITTGNAMPTIERDGNPAIQSVAGFESRPSLTNTMDDYAEQPGKENCSANLSEVRRGVSGWPVRGEARPGEDVQPEVRELAQTTDAGGLESTEERATTDGGTLEGSGKGSRLASDSKRGIGAEAVRGVRDDGGHSGASRRSQRTAERPLALPEAPSGDRGRNSSWPDTVEPAESHTTSSEALGIAPDLERNALRELAEEAQRIVEAMTSEQREDLLPDWFESRLNAVLVGRLGIAPGAMPDFRVLASAMRKVLPPALLAEVVAHLDPLTPFVEFLRTYDATPPASPTQE